MMHLVERHAHISLYGPFAFVVSTGQAVIGFMSSSPFEHFLGVVGAISSFLIACATIQNAKTNRMNAETSRMAEIRLSDKKKVANEQEGRRT